MKTLYNNASYKSWGFGGLPSNCYLQILLAVDKETGRKTQPLHMLDRYVAFKTA